MDEFTVEIPGVKPVKLQVYFTNDLLDFGIKTKYGYTRRQFVTTCIIRKRGLTLGTGVAIMHPDDNSSNEIGYREAFKKAARESGWQYMVRCMSKTDYKNYTGEVALWKSIYSAWRKSRRDEVEAEKAEV